MVDPLNESWAAAGIYEQLVTGELQHHIDELRDGGWNVIDEAVATELAPHALARHVGSMVEQALTGLTTVEQVLAANMILKALGSQIQHPDADLLHITEGPRQLLALSEPQEAPDRYRTRPSTPLSESALFTNAPEEPSLGSELELEIASADRIDLLCAFVKWRGLRVLEDPLKEAKDRGVPVRVITTTYMGATEKTALDRLVREFDAEVKINYEVRSTRLHAKAWMFRRNSGYDTAYVGSSNLSKSALLEGLEWNVRASSVATPSVMSKFEATFDVYWGDASFEEYDPDRDGERLAEALKQAGRAVTTGAQALSLPGREVRPFPHQKDMLDRLTIEREVHGTHRNLLVAATGTGKTVMAALDYKSLREKHGRNLRLLFIAHRREILDQALRTYRKVLSDSRFGELLVGGATPEKNEHVFASIQTLQSGSLGDKFTADHFDVIVIDEFHHSAAETYKQVIEFFHPKEEFLGLTATPERGDGNHVHNMYFKGRIAAEMRLWEALENQLLSPFHYFGIADDTDYTSVEWKRGGGYDIAQLSDLLTENDPRAELILSSLGDKVTDFDSMRALGFCVTVKHANYMAQYFHDRGIRAVALDGTWSKEARDHALEEFKAGRLQVLFSVDLFNEGLDIPDVDTLLLLRPTSSPTVFLQQFGRGLRRTANKPVLTVLDFIGQHRREYHFEPQYKSLTGLTRKRLLASAEAGFPNLPAGCRLILDKKSKERVVENIRSQIDVNVKRLAEEVREVGTLELAEYLQETGRDLKELYRGKESSWTTLLRRADLLPSPAPQGEGELLKRVFAFLHVDDSFRVHAYQRVLEDDATPYDELSDSDQAFARMLFFSLWPGGGGFSSYEEGLSTLREQTHFRHEVRQVLKYNLEHTETLPIRDDRLPETLLVHCAYSREEYLPALGEAELGGALPNNFREGAKWCKAEKTDALFVTLEKEEKDFSPETRYQDYAMGPDLFHWESQNATSPTSEVGKRYQNHQTRGSQVLLFVRRYKTTDIGRPHPSTLLGPVEYVSHKGSKPMAIVWKLNHELPADVLTYSSITHT
ncbi:helicase [Streptomyces abyssalis]|uniref:Helicase n=1 Tax=Streptomyces abyssalis TaxID=933944 RepID=A0A1E7JP12_9ACTN|nr:DEAD/DEAH box helicase [Streptomyces abyssalis]OEU86592.1 helicase [Streptomyces abyssalis]OEU90021.1 helicase [Streptomyces abyssalis]